MIAIWIVARKRLGSAVRRDAVRAAPDPDALLLDPGVQAYFLKLMAAHALFVQCGDRICSGEDGMRAGVLRDQVQSLNKVRERRGHPTGIADHQRVHRPERLEATVGGARVLTGPLDGGEEGGEVG